MASLKEHVINLFSDSSELDSDLKNIIEDNIKIKYGTSISLKNLKFAETASHTMFFNSRKKNSLSNAPLNSKIFSYINDCNISLSLSTSKIKLNNPSSPQYLDFFGELVRSFPNKYKKNYIYCLTKLTTAQLKKYQEQLELCHKRHLIKKMPSYKRTNLLGNKGCANNLAYLNRCINRNIKDTTLIDRQIEFRMNIYRDLLSNLLYSSENSNHKNLADQVNFTQSDLINNVFNSDITHYYLHLEEIGNALFLIKLSDCDSFIYKMFSDPAIHRSIPAFFAESLFLRKDDLSLTPIDNKDLIQYNLSDLKSEIKNDKFIINIKFNLFNLSFYGLQTFGGRFQKKYLAEYIETFSNFLSKNFIANNAYLDSLNNRLTKIKFVDIASMIIAKNDNNSLFCDYNSLLLKKYNLDDKISHLLNQDIEDIIKNTQDYLKYKK